MSSAANLVSLLRRPTYNICLVIVVLTGMHSFFFVFNEMHSPGASMVPLLRAKGTLVPYFVFQKERVVYESIDDSPPIFRKVSEDFIDVSHHNLTRNYAILETFRYWAIILIGFQGFEMEQDRNLLVRTVVRSTVER